MIGIFYYVAGACLLASAVAVGFQRRDADGMRIASTFALLASGFAFSGFMFRNLDARSRYAGSIMSALALFAFPIGAVLGGYVLYLIHSKQGRTILSPEYREVVAKTPEFKCRPAHAALALGIGLTAFAVYGVLRIFLTIAPAAGS